LGFCCMKLGMQRQAIFMFNAAIRARNKNRSRYIEEDIYRVKGYLDELDELGKKTVRKLGEKSLMKMRLESWNVDT
jgi:hypothetical protein